METVIILDTETTGMDIETAEIVEIFALKLKGEFPVLRRAEIFYSLVKPAGPMPPECSAVHGLVGEDLNDAPDAESIAADLTAFMDGCDVVCGHNALSFDVPLLQRIFGAGAAPAPVLDTLRLAHHAWPELPAIGGAPASYSLQALRYRFGLGPVEDGWTVSEATLLHSVRIGPHAAAFDAFVCRLLLGECIKDLCNKGIRAQSFLELAAGSLKPYQVHIMPFGKHRGERLENVPRSYIRWALNNTDALDDDLRASMEEL